MKNFKIYINIVVKELFTISLITYLILLTAELVKDGFVSFIFNLNTLLVVVLGSGLILVITDFKKEETTLKSSNDRIWYYFFKKMHLKKETETKWNYALKELRAKTFIENDLKLSYKDWILYFKEKDLSNRLVTFHPVPQRDWHYFLSKIRTSKIPAFAMTYVFMISALCGLSIYLKLQDIGDLSILIGILTSLFIYLLAHLLFTDFS